MADSERCTQSDEEGSLVLSFSSSSFEDEEDNVVGDGVRPYMYEPYIDSDVESVDEVENDVSVSDPQELEEEDRLTSRNWKYRYTAYRQLVRWAWNYLGRTIRVVIPSCAVKAIRARYPSESDTYTGFKDAVESDC